MRVLGVVVLAGLAGLWAAGCNNETRTDVPPLEPTEVSATAGADHGPVVIEPTPPAPKGDLPAGSVPKTYTVQKSQGLMAVARAVYGDANASMYKKIYEANKDKIGPPPTYDLKVGTVLSIPPK
jgi:nucleoid-associated protein YgaU